MWGGGGKGKGVDLCEWVCVGWVGVKGVKQYTTLFNI